MNKFPHYSDNTSNYFFFFFFLKKKVIRVSDEKKIGAVIKLGLMILVEFISEMGPVTNTDTQVLQLDCAHRHPSEIYFSIHSGNESRNRNYYCSFSGCRYL